ncbi:hypothetical protein TNCV_1710681 [Trichonephila clavipes]|nr:hypothetical protein TNCV_1710681 [Trichonephila clavipes]
MWVRRGSSNLMAGKVVFLRGLLNPIGVVDLMSVFELLTFGLKVNALDDRNGNGRIPIRDSC